jgi:hypothetical protein
LCTIEPIVRRLALLAAGVALALMACSARGPLGEVQGASRNCADLFASAMVSKTAVRGSWDCLAPTIQDQFRSVGLDGDSGVAQLAAKDPVYSREQFMGRLSDGGYVYGMSGASGASVLLVWLDQAGRISDIQSGGRASSH